MIRKLLAALLALALSAAPCMAQSGGPTGGGGGSGGAGAMVLIDTQTTVAGASLTFSSLGSYNHLRMLCSTGDTTNNSGTSLLLAMRFNGDTGSNYNFTQQGTYQNGSSFNNFSGSTTSAPFGSNPAAGTAGVPFGFNQADIVDYRGSAQKAVRGQSTAYQGSVGVLQIATSAYWTSTSAITSITVMTSGTGFSTGSKCWLYGIT